MCRGFYERTKFLAMYKICYKKEYYYFVPTINV